MGQRRDGGPRGSDGNHRRGRDRRHQGIAGEEETKTLGVLLSTPINRTTFILAKATAMVILVVIIGVASYVGLLIGSVVGDMGLSQSGMIGASVHITAVGIFFGGVATLLAPPPASGASLLVPPGDLPDCPSPQQASCHCRNR
ncbi:ABC transporter permease [Ornithinimicrobium sp. INDO-MA30-4]|uniref:ABC transporter permease n=1 Tax=Ornithinimicrobium sp. INDO-MA30-4 TaxID=2908651 RepID=UPI001F319308|nr:ABC transporter permease subunit [Ornithinimicrobium sp. INDO-MA30-4]UJH70359.1 ABC transporter permease subunit [Ornithinimicrobium sp. INDO-MA30-4]